MMKFSTVVVSALLLLTSLDATSAARRSSFHKTVEKKRRQLSRQFFQQQQQQQPLDSHNDVDKDLLEMGRQMKEQMILAHHQEEEEQQQRSLVSDTCDTAGTTLDATYPQFSDYYDSVIGAIDTSCPSPPCNVDGVELKGSAAFNELVEQCESIDNAVAHEEFADVNCFSLGFAVENLFRCIPSECNAADIASGENLQEANWENYFQVTFNLTCEVEYESSPICSTTCCKKYDDLHAETNTFDDHTEDVIREAIQCGLTGCSVKSVDGKEFVGDTKYNAMMEECQGIANAVPITLNYESKNCDDTQFDHSVTNVLDCVPEECNNDLDKEDFEQQTQRELELVFQESFDPSCIVQVTVEILGDSDTSNAISMWSFGSGFLLGSTTTILTTLAMFGGVVF